LSGEVSVEITTDFPERFAPGARLEWRRGTETRSLVVAAGRPHGSRWLVRFEGVEGPIAAKALSGGELEVPEAEALAAPAGAYYSHEIEGWRCEDARGTALGAVEGLERTPGGALLTVKTPEGKSVLVPFVEAIVLRIDREGRRVILDPPAGLFEL
jgi:16S rRNA processing protein RimM